MNTWRIPFNRASLAGEELRYMREAIANGHISGDGPFTSRCESLLQRELAAPRVLLTTSGTHALELAAHLLDMEPGNEVVVPSFAFPSCAAAFALRGARIVFCDVRLDTLNLDESLLERHLGPRTAPDYRTRLADHLRARGILAVFHYLPLHLSAMGRLFGGESGQCPETEDVSERLLRLPFFTSMTEIEQAEVVEAIERFGG